MVAADEAAARYGPRPVPHMGPPAAEWSAAAPLPPDWPAGPVPPEWAAATAPPRSATSKVPNTTSATDSLICAMQDENEAKSARVLLCLQAKDEEITELHAANEALREALSVREQSIEELQLSQQACHVPHTYLFVRVQPNSHRELHLSLSRSLRFGLGLGLEVGVAFELHAPCTHQHAPRTRHARTLPVSGGGTPVDAARRYARRARRDGGRVSRAGGAAGGCLAATGGAAHGNGRG